MAASSKSGFGVSVKYHVLEYGCEFKGVLIADQEPGCIFQYVPTGN